MQVILYNLNRNWPQMLASLCAICSWLWLRILFRAVCCSFCIR